MSTTTFSTSVTQPHETLIHACTKGDQRAQCKIYHLYVKAMHHIAMRFTQDEMEAEDVVQEAFVRAFKNIKSFKGDATFGAWLKRIVINTAINHLKKRKAEFVQLEDQGADFIEETYEEVDYGVNVARVKEAIRSLPTGYRMVLSLYLLEGYDHGEISRILGISEATSKSQYSRARKKLRGWLEGDCPKIPTPRYMSSYQPVSSVA
ncbi:MAG: sigma-70 family RNA polymerase sigma factor [Bacteroidota bacterium]